MLGTIYANLFPNRVRAFVIDGVLDPTAWTTGAPGQEELPFSTRLRNAAGTQASLGEFFRLRDAAGLDFAFSGNSAERFAPCGRSCSRGRSSSSSLRPGWYRAWKASSSTVTSSQGGCRRPHRTRLGPQRLRRFRSASEKAR
jgi:hypothetical protein